MFQTKSHTNRTLQSTAAKAHAEELFDNPKKIEPGESFDAKSYRENEERIVQEKIDRLRALRKANNIINPQSTKQRRQRASKRTPEAVE